MGRKKVDIKDKKLFLNFVYLSEEEYAQLCTKLGKEATDKWIQELNGGIGQHGYKYVSHYWTIENWARKKAEAIAAKVPPQPTGSVLVDRVIEQLKDPNSYMPEDPKIRPALHAMLLEMRLNWPRLRMLLKEAPTLEPKIREEFLKAYHGN